MAPQPIPIRITKAMDVTIWIARHQATSLAPPLAGECQEVPQGSYSSPGH